MNTAEKLPSACKRCFSSRSSGNLMRHNVDSDQASDTHQHTGQGKAVLGMQLREHLSLAVVRVIDPRDLAVFASSLS